MNYFSKNSRNQHQKPYIYKPHMNSFCTLFGVIFKSFWGFHKISVLTPKRPFLFLLVMAFEGKRVHSKTNIFQIFSSNKGKDSGNLAFFSIEKTSFHHTIFFSSGNIFLVKVCLVLSATSLNTARSGKSSKTQLVPAHQTHKGSPAKIR